MFLLPAWVYAQPWPVTVNVSVSRFSGGLEAYDDPGRVIVTLLSTDDRPEYAVQLRLRLSGEGVSVGSRPEPLTPPITLRRFQPVVLTGAQLRPWLDPATLEFSPSGAAGFFEGGALLPEGPVSLCVEVYDYQRFFDPPVSNTGCALGLLQLHRPPVLIEPGASVTPLGGVQQLRFVWQPQHAGVAALYTLELYEDLPGFAPDLVVSATAPLAVIGTPTPFFLYTQSQPLLHAGSDYLARVRAYDPSGQASFLNDGWSEVYRFHYGGRESAPDCPLPAAPLLLTATDSSLLWGWTPADSTAAHRLRYRPAGSADWLTLPAAPDPAPARLLTGLAPDSAYEVELCLQCPDGNWRCAPPAAGRTLPDPPPTDSLLTDSLLLAGRCRISMDEGYAYECGQEAVISPFGDVPPASVLVAGDSIWAADFLVVLTAVEGRGSFSGEGYVTVPYFNNARLGVTFAGIGVNAHCRMTSGEIEVTGATLAVLDELDGLNDLTNQLLNGLDSLDNWLGQAEDILGAAQDILGQLATQADYAEAQQQALAAAISAAQSFPFLPDSLSEALSAGLDCLDQAPNDEAFADCRAQLDSALSDALALMEELYARAPFAVRFSAHPGQRYGFDAYAYEPHRGHYAHKEIAGEAYAVPWKSMPTAGPDDRVQARPAEGVTFVDQNRAALARADSAGVAILTLSMGSQLVYATTGQDSTLAVAGQLQVARYDPQPLRVVLLPVNGASVPPEAAAEAARILRQAVVEVEVSQGPPLIVAEFDGSLSALPSGFAANYNEEMRALIRAAKRALTPEDGVCYVLVVAGSEEPGRLGYMPRGRGWGFVYAQPHGGDGLMLGRTLAHELLHGAYALEHTFAAYPELTPGSTDNVMDYGSGFHLHKYQWDLIHNPERHLGWFDEDEEGALAALAPDACDIVFEYLGSAHTYTCLTPAGERYALPRRAIAHFHPDAGYGWPRGALKSFEWDGRTYVGWTREGKFKGYSQASNSNPPHPIAFRPSETTQGSSGLVFAAGYGVTGSNCEAGIIQYEGELEAPWHDPAHTRAVLSTPLPLSELSALSASAIGRTSFAAGCRCAEDQGEDQALTCITRDGEGQYSEEEVGELVNLLNSAVSTRDIYTAGVRPKTLKIHLLAGAASRVGLLPWQRDYLEEQLYLLKYHTQTDFYVIFHSRGELYSRTALDSLTRAVREGSLLGSRERAILVLIPYTSVADGLLDTDACGSIDVSATAGLLGDACEANGTDAYEYLLGILSCVPKPVWIKRMTQLCNGDVVLGEVSSGGQWERGYPFVSLLQAFKSPHRDMLMSWEPGWQARQSPELMAQWYALYREKMRESIAADNLAAATHDKDYWQKDARSVMLRPSYITDTTVVQAYTAYHYEFSISPLGATVTAAYNPELNSDHLYNGLVSMELIDQIAYRTVDVLGFIPFVDVWAEGTGAVYALIRGDAQRALLLGASVIIIKNFDAFLKAGGKGPAQVVAKYTDEGIEYVAKEVDDAIDDAFEAVRLELDVHDPEIARRAAGGGPYNGHHHPADALYANRHGAIYEGVGRDVAKAKLITGEIADHCPLLLANPQLVTRELSEVLAGMLDATQRKAFLEALDGFGDIEKLTTFVDDLANAPELVVALKGKWELVRAWQLTSSSELVRTNSDHLKKVSDAINPATHNYHFEDLKRAFEASSDKERFVELLNPDFLVTVGGNRVFDTDPVIIQQALNTITQIRSSNVIGGTRNIAYLEGQINGQVFDPTLNFRVSNDQLNSSPIFEPSFVARHVRDTDSEFKLLDDLAKQYGATSTSNRILGVTGTIRLVSEKPFCASCSRIITEFSVMFPNVNITMVNGVQ